MQPKNSVKNNNSFVSTNYTRANQQNADSFQHIDSQAAKSQILDGAWNDPRIVNSINEQDGRSKTCCDAEHLPHNEMNPQCYKNASGIASRIPYAG